MLNLGNGSSSHMVDLIGNVDYETIVVNDFEQVIALDVLVINVNDNYDRSLLYEWLVFTKRKSTALVWITSESIPEEDKLLFLRMGAHGIVKKTQSMSELMVVIQNSLDSVDKLKRLKIEDSQLTNSKEKVLLNYENRSIQLEETEIVLTVLEFRLIDALFKKKDSVITYDTLANILWKNAKDMPDNVRVYRLSNIIFHLRNKISTFEDQIKIRTIRSRGYKLEWNS